MFRKNFLFGVDCMTTNGSRVTAEDLYEPKKGYGFVIEENRRQQELLKLSELNSGFDTMYWYQDKNLTQIECDEDGCFIDTKAILDMLAEEEGGYYPGEMRRMPLCFKLDVPRQGNYLATITIRAKEKMEDVQIFTGRRRLAYKGTIEAGKEFCLETVINVCDIVPRGQERTYADTTLDITVVADKPRLTSISVVETECPTIYIAGDSTVTDQSAEYPYAPGTSYSGWGQMLTAYLNLNIAVSNHAHSGLTTDSFRKEGHYAIIAQYSKHQDYYFLQFGHNDQKLNELKANGGYRTNMLGYINECRSRGAYPVLVTPLARNSWKGDGTYNDLLEEYAEAVKEIGRVTETPVLDLHGLSKKFIKSQGLEASKAYLFPNDFTHSNDYGAYKMAGFLAQEIKHVCGQHTSPSYRFLAKCVTEGFGEWRNKEEIVLPVKPEKYENITNPNGGELLLAEVENLEDPADRVAVLDMLIKTARFFPTNVYNDMYEDIVGHEWYAGTVEVAYQNGIILPELTKENHFFPTKEVTVEELMVFAMNAYSSRKTLPEQEPCAYDDKCAAYARKYVRAACSLGLLEKSGREDLQRVVLRGEVVNLCREMKI